MLNVKHHDKATFFELLLLNLRDFNGLLGSQLQFVQLIKL
jgi:hypothetical protein